MSITKIHRYQTIEVSVETKSLNIRKEAVSSFLAKYGFESTKFPVSQISDGAQVKKGSVIFFECDESHSAWYKLTRIVGQNQIQIEAGSCFSFKTEENFIVFTAKGTRVQSQWTIRCFQSDTPYLSDSEVTTLINTLEDKYGTPSDIDMEAMESLAPEIADVLSIEFNMPVSVVKKLPPEKRYFLVREYMLKK